MTIIGTDISLDVCKAEGYMMLEYDETKEFDRNEQYRLFNHYPVIHKELNNEIQNDTTMSFNELVEEYQKDKESINSCCDTEKVVDFENPTYFDLLNLATDISGYKGLP